jgi:hypothetical protein
MALFLAINTSSVTLLPTGVIALRAAAGSSDPAAILPTTLFATIGSTAVAIIAAKLYSRWSPLTPPVDGRTPMPQPRTTGSDNDPTIGPDSYIGYLVTTLQGSTETTFYVLAVYFSAVQVKRLRHAMAAALTADLAGIVCAVVVCRYLFS